MKLIRVESDCVGCPKELGCLYEACPYYRVIRHYCDKCGEEDDLYYFDDEELCPSCIIQQLKPVEYED